MIWDLIRLGFILVVSVYLFNMAMGVLIMIVTLIVTALGGAWTGIKNLFKED